MITNKEALAAAMTLRDYCEERSCRECIFDVEDNLGCGVGRIPAEWDLLKIKLPEEAKEHLMQRFTKTM